GEGPAIGDRSFVARAADEAEVHGHIRVGGRRRNGKGHLVGDCPSDVIRFRVSAAAVLAFERVGPHLDELEVVLILDDRAEEDLDRLADAIGSNLRASRLAKNEAVAGDAVDLPEERSVVARRQVTEARAGRIAADADPFARNETEAGHIDGTRV